MSTTPNIQSQPPDRTPRPQSPSPGAEETPAELGQYRLLGPLGQGGMGQVYKALHLRLKREVAIKFLRGLGSDSEGSLKRFLVEMEALGRLDHPNIVRATDAGDWHGHPYLVMESLQGADLHKLVGALGPLPTADACEMIRQAACGLQYAHEKGLVHRDLKPSNLFLTEAGQVKILDLGLARIEDQLTGSGLTPHGAVVGTLDYMAPEQASDSHTVDIRADLYSLGCTLYHLLAGFAPFHGPAYRGAAQKLFAHASASPRPLRESRPDVPAALAALVERLLAKRPDDRYDRPRDLEPLLRPFTAGADPVHLIPLFQGRQVDAGAETRSELRPPTNIPDANSPAADVTPAAPAPSAPQAPAPRRWVGIAAGLGGALVFGLIAFAFFLGSSRTSGPPSAPISDPAPSAPGPKVDEHDLLARPPALLWQPKRDFTWNYDPVKREFFFLASDLCLFQFGESATADYGFEVVLSCNSPDDRAGLFFGSQRKPNGVRPYSGRFYSFATSPLVPAPGQQGVALELTPCLLDFDSGNRGNEMTLLSVPGPIPWGEQRVRVQVAQGKIVQLAFGPTDLHDRLAALPPLKEPTGGFGVYVERGSGFVRSATLLSPEKEP